MSFVEKAVNRLHIKWEALYISSTISNSAINCGTKKCVQFCAGLPPLDDQDRCQPEPALPNPTDKQAAVPQTSKNSWSLSRIFKHSKAACTTVTEN